MESRSNLRQAQLLVRSLLNLRGWDIAKTAASEQSSRTDLELPDYSAESEEPGKASDYSAEPIKSQSGTVAREVTAVTETRSPYVLRGYGLGISHIAIYGSPDDIFSIKRVSATEPANAETGETLAWCNVLPNGLSSLPALIRR